MKALALNPGKGAHISFEEGSRVFEGTVISAYSHTLYVEVHDTEERGKRKFDCTDAIGSTVAIPKVQVHEIFND